VFKGDFFIPDKTMSLAKILFLAGVGTGAAFVKSCRNSQDFEVNERGKEAIIDTC
jgi:hypothetical protein